MIPNSQRVEATQSGWINNTWYMRAMGCHSALKKERILTRATTWVSLADIVLSELSQSPKDNYYVIVPMGGPWSSQIHGDRKGTRGCPGRRGGGVWGC